jgi:hypothetical protein
MPRESAKPTTRPTTRAGRAARTIGQKTGYPEADNASDLLATGGISDTDRRFETYRASNVTTADERREVNPFSKFAAPHNVWDPRDDEVEWTGDVHASAWELRQLYEHHAECRSVVRASDAGLRLAGVDPAWLRAIDLGEIPHAIRYTRHGSRDAYQMPVRATRNSGTALPPKEDSDHGDVARLMQLSAARRAPYERALDGAPEWLTFDLLLAAEGGMPYSQLAKHAGVSDVTMARHLGDAMRRLEDTGPMLREGHEGVKAWLLADIAKADHDKRAVWKTLLTAPLLWFGDKAMHAKMTAPTPLADAQRRQREAAAEVKRRARVAQSKADADAFRAADAARCDSMAEREAWLDQLPGRNQTTLTERQRAETSGEEMARATAALSVRWHDELKAEAKKMRQEAKARNNVAIVEKPFENATPAQSIEWRGNVSPTSPTVRTVTFAPPIRHGYGDYFLTSSNRQPTNERAMMMNGLKRAPNAALRVNRSVRTLERHLREGIGPEPTWIQGERFFTDAAIEAYAARLAARA